MELVLKGFFDLCDENKINVSYKNEGLGFAFIFERKNTQLLQINDGINDIIKYELTESEKLVLNYILENKIISNASVLAEKLNKSPVTIQRNLKKLVELNLIERIGSNKTGYWLIKNKLSD